MNRIILFSSLLQQQKLVLGLPWWGWLLIILAIALIVWLLLSEKPHQEPQAKLNMASKGVDMPIEEEPLAPGAAASLDEAEVLATQKSGLELEQKANDLLLTLGKVESFEMIETDLDGQPGPEVVQIVETISAETDGMVVKRTTETHESLVDGEFVRGVAETTHIDTDGLDVTRVKQETKTESDQVSLVENLDAFVVDSQGVDFTEVAESAFDERTGVGAIDITTTAIDEPKGVGSVDNLQAVISPESETGQEPENEAEQALDKAVFDEIMEDLGISDEEAPPEGMAE